MIPPTDPEIAHACEVLFAAAICRGGNFVGGTSTLTVRGERQPAALLAALGPHAEAVASLRRQFLRQDTASLVASIEVYP